MAASTVVSRPRLERLLAGAWERRVTLVVAGGGYGKTTALRALTSNGRAHWLALTAADREVEVLASRLMQAVGVQPNGQTVPAPALGAADRQSLAEGQADLICRNLDSQPAAVMIVLDDADQLSDEDSAAQLVRALCLQAPSRLHMVLSGRRLPALGLGWASGRGELLELSAPDLAFTVDEVASLLSARLGTEAGTLAEECWSLTAGWPAAVQLIADRLERLDRGDWQRTLTELPRRRGQVWRAFAADLVAGEPEQSQRVIEIAGIAPVIDEGLLAGLGLGAGAHELDSLQSRGLLVAAGGGGQTLSPVLSDVVAERLSTGEADELRHRVADWLEQAGRLREALECVTAGSSGDAIPLLRRRGRELVADGYGSRVAEVLLALGRGLGLELDTIRGEALIAAGDWDGAMELFSAIKAASAGLALPSPTAWRFGALLYLRGEIEAAQEVLAAAYDEQQASADDALVSAWLSANLWGRGDVDEACQTAEVALRQADASGDAAARAAAHVAVALCAASRGDRQRNERHYRLALTAASQAGDSIQLARIHANLSSKAVEEGDYRTAVEQADLALSAGAGHNLFGAIAMCNKAEALMHSGELEEARALIVQATEMFSSLGSLLDATPYTLLGALEAERGDLVRARISLERAYRIAEQAGDVHSLVLALSGLAAVLAQDDPVAARQQARDSAERATSLERAYALCVWSWVELCAGDEASAASLAGQAEAEARRTGDRASLARALELRGAASQPPNLAQLRAAAELWREIGDPIAEGRAELMLAACTADTPRIEALRDELSRRGVRPEVGVAGLLLSAQQPTFEIAVTTLGRFAVLRDGQPIPLVAWQSRKARDLLKLLASRRGRAVTRDAAAEALWPNDDPGPLANRLSVALSTLRKVLDPDRSHPADHFIAADQQSLSLRVGNVGLDVTGFLKAAQAGIALAAQNDWAAAENKLREAERLYTGDFLEEDLYEDWAVDCREEARSAGQEVSRLLARAAVRREDDEDGVRHLRRLLERDPYDGDAWTALLAALLRMRRYGEARRQHAVYARRMAELEIPPVPLADTVDARP